MSLSVKNPYVIIAFGVGAILRSLKSFRAGFSYFLLVCVQFNHFSNLILFTGATDANLLTESSRTDPENFDTSAVFVFLCLFAHWNGLPKYFPNRSFLIEVRSGAYLRVHSNICGTR